MKYSIPNTFLLLSIVFKLNGLTPVLKSMPTAAEIGVLPASDVQVDTFQVNTKRSIVKWKGTKFWGAGKHEGILQIESGELYIRDEAIAGGWFVMDMHSIEVTDIPKTDPVPRKRLRDHLLNEDFFAVTKYPTSRFEITSATEKEGRRHTIDGRLTLRGRTHPVMFDATAPLLSENAIEAVATFSINRHHWGVSFKGSRLTNDLVDDLIYLDILLSCEVLR